MTEINNSNVVSFRLKPEQIDALTDYAKNNGLRSVSLAAKKLLEKQLQGEMK